MNLFYQKNFLKLLDFTPAEISDLLALAAKLKTEKLSLIHISEPTRP